MNQPCSAILNDIVQSLRQCSRFSAVSLGLSPEMALPRATVKIEGFEVVEADDSATARWGKLTATISINVRDEAAGKAATRAVQLAEAATAALLADPFRSGLCKDLPIGRATEVGIARLTPLVRQPDSEISITIRCHFEEVA